jgi:hypothetical protein
MTECADEQDLLIRPRQALDVLLPVLDSIPDMGLVTTE